jgi:hypothetical protein
LLKQIQEVFTETQEQFTGAHLRAPRRLLMLRHGREVFHPFIQCRCATSAGELIIRDNAIPHLERIRTGRMDFDSRRLIQIGGRSPAQVHTR